MALYGRAVNDIWYQAETGEFADGHRLITSPLVVVEGNRYYTENTCYILIDETKIRIIGCGAAGKYLVELLFSGKIRIVFI